MVKELYKDLAKQYLQAIEDENIDCFEEIIHPDYFPGISKMPNTTLEVVHQLGADTKAKGIQNLKQRFLHFYKIWQDVSITNLELIGEKDTVIAYYDMSYTHAGSFLGISATHKRVKAKTYHNFKFKDDKIISAHMQHDFFSVIRQIGLDVYENEEILIKEYLDRIKKDQTLNLI